MSLNESCDQGLCNTLSLMVLSDTEVSEGDFARAPASSEEYVPPYCAFGHKCQHLSGCGRFSEYLVWQKPEGRPVTVAQLDNLAIQI